MGIEPTRPAWKAGVLPLNYARVTARHKLRQPAESINANPHQTESMRWGRQDSNLRRLRHQIYSLAHLTALEHPLNACNYSKNEAENPPLETHRHACRSSL